MLHNYVNIVFLQIFTHCVIFYEDRRKIMHFSKIFIKMVMVLKNNFRKLKLATI